MSEIIKKEQGQVEAQRQEVQPTAIDNAILHASQMENFDIDKFERLIQVQQEIANQNRIDAFNADLAECQTEMPAIRKTAIGHNNKYAKLEDILNAILPTLSKYGFSISYETDTREKVTVSAVLKHKQGHSIRSTITLPIDTAGSNQLQKIGSSLTYGKRYALSSVLNLEISENAPSAEQQYFGQVISPQQAERMRDALEEIDQDLDRFLGAYKATSVDNFPLQQYEKAMQMLKKKKTAQYKEANQ